MATFIAVSGPASTGKTSIVESLSNCKEISGAIIVPDIFNSVFQELVEQGFFREFSEIATDYEYLCIYLVRVIESYRNIINQYSDSDKLVILDGCWVDISIYATINMWYTRVIHEVQESIFRQINKFDTNISKIYFTSDEEDKRLANRSRSQFKVSTIKSNRALEIQYYELAKNIKNGVSIPTGLTPEEIAIFILEDMKK